MKRAIIDNFVDICYSNCFTCKQVIILKIMFLEDPANITDYKLEWAMNLLLNTPIWKWMRTSNCECQRACMKCVDKKKQMTKLVLTRGYGAVPRSITPRPKTLPDLIQMLDLGRIE